MAAKKEKGSVDALRADVQALSEAFFSFREAMLADAAVSQAEQRGPASAGGFTAPQDADIDAAASILAALGQPQRLRIVMLLAEESTSVPVMVEKLGLKTTGAAYHHLNVLTNGGIVEQPQRGTFALTVSASGRVESLLNALLGSPETSKKKKK